MSIPIGNGRTESFNVLAFNETRLTTPSVICRVSMKGRELDSIKTCEYVDNPSEYVREHRDGFDEDIILIRADTSLELDNPDAFNDRSVIEVFHNVRDFYRL